VARRGMQNAKCKMKALAEVEARLSFFIFPFSFLFWSSRPE
jgi:hypothetical protein